VDPDLPNTIDVLQLHIAAITLNGGACNVTLDSATPSG